LLWLTTRETVAIDTPANRATASMEGSVFMDSIVVEGVRESFPVFS
jgi:hypothetical protein